MRTIAEGHEPLDYFIDLSSINVFADNGEIWVPDETMVDVFIVSSDVDIVYVGEGGTNGNVCFGAPGAATVEFHVYYEGKLIALYTEDFLVYDNDRVKQEPQKLFVKFQDRNSGTQIGEKPQAKAELGDR